MIKINTTLEALYENEIRNSLIYLNFATRLQSLSLNNLAFYFNLQSEEEKTHSEKFKDFLVDMDYVPQLRGINNIPDYSQATVLEIAEDFLKLEKIVTENLELAYIEAEENRDFLSVTLLHWFINEQIEELGKAKDFLDKIRMVLSSGNLASLVLFDIEIEV